MKIHYFQRYHEKENVATANTMLLLSRLYSYSSDKFFRFLKSEFFSDSFEPEIVFTLQEKSVDSIPDATITQEGFKIVVETKMSDWFYSDQLMRHLKSFGDEKYKVLITLAPELMDKEKKTKFENELKKYNAIQMHPVIHINTTFEYLANAVQDVIDDRDYEMQDGDSHGYDLRTIKHRYFFVEKFYETDFKKITPRAPMGSRIFDLTQIIGTDDIPETKELAEILKKNTWS